MSARDVAIAACEKLLKEKDEALLAFSTVVLSLGAEGLAVPAEQAWHPVSLWTVPTETVHSPAWQLRCARHT